MSNSTTIQKQVILESSLGESRNLDDNTTDKVLQNQQQEANNDIEKITESCVNITTTQITKGVNDKDLMEAMAVMELLPKVANTNENGTEDKNELPGCSLSSKAIVPLPSSLPSKMLRLHVKRPAEQIAIQNQSIDSQLESDESMIAENNSGEDFNSEGFGVSIPSASPMTLEGSPGSPVEISDERLDVGMGSSIDGSEESEVDDELKPLAKDNHVLDVKPSTSSSKIQSNSTAELSEANLEKFRKNYHLQTDNTYLHPNFKYNYVGLEKNTSESSPPPAVAPANSPTEAIQQQRVHRTFLNMSKKAEDLQDPDNSVISQSTSVSDRAAFNEIDSLDLSLIPNDEVAGEIVDAVEFYFSNDNILKDAFLLKHVRRNKEGFVSLKLVSSFKHVRQLTKDWRVVGHAIRRKSRKIELNDLGTKVRRLEPLPNFDETMPSRTIVACDLPMDKLTIEKVSDIFSKCGEIALIRILKPGMSTPVDVRQFMNKYPEMQQKECVLIEYLESAAAREARNLQGSFKVYEMVAPKKKTGKKTVLQIAAPVVRMVENYRHLSEQNYERTRGGSFSGVMPQHDTDLRFKLRRINSDIHHRLHGDMSVHMQPHLHSLQTQFNNNNNQESFSNTNYYQQHQNTRTSFGDNQEHQTPFSSSNNMNYYSYEPRSLNNIPITKNNGDRPLTKMAPLTPQTIGYNNNNSNIIQRGPTQHTPYSVDYNNRHVINYSTENAPLQRRDTNYVDNYLSSRRFSDVSQKDLYRKNSQSSLTASDRRFSNDFMPFERSYSNASDLSHYRKSNDFQQERKSSLETHIGTPYEDSNVGGGGGGYNVFPRRYSNTFNNISNKMAAYDSAQFIGGRRISTDSGYDRRYSFGSEYENSPRSRTGSFLNNYKQHGVDDGQPRSRSGSFLDGSPRSRSGSFAQRTTETLVRTPLGPDGSKGFATRMRKMAEGVATVN